MNLLDLSLPSLISFFACIVIAAVCTLIIIRYNQQIGAVVTLCLVVLMLSCVGLAFDETDGKTFIWSIPAFRVAGAIASVVVYFRLQRFWSRYGRFLNGLMGR